MSAVRQRVGQRLGLPSLVALVAVIGAGAILMVAGDGDSGKRLTMVAPRAPILIPGNEVRMAGQRVGEVAEAEVTPDHRAHLELEIDEDSVWPLPQGTEARLRMGGTVKYGARYVELVPPREDAPPIPEGAEIPARDVSTTVEFDELFSTFDRPTRRNLGATLDLGGVALDHAEHGLRRVLERTPPAVGRARALLEDLVDDPMALQGLVRSSDRLMQAVNEADPGVGELVSGAATTLDAVASRSRALAMTLQEMPSSLATVRRTLAHADHTLTAANDLTGRLAPGVSELRKLASPLVSVLDRVERIGPDARNALASLRRAAPHLNPMLARATALMPRLESVGLQAAKQVRCVRPYAPEVASWATTWAGFSTAADSKDHYLRAEAGGFPAPTGTTQTTPEFIASLPPNFGLSIAFPRPPGEIFGQPWFQPECGITEDALDPSKDPEAQAFDPLAKPLIEVVDDDTEGGR